MTTILSPNRHRGRNRPVRLVVLHAMEVPESNNVAEAVARQFQNKARKASAHVCIDPDSEVRCVPDEDTAWAAPGANADGLQAELAGYAGQTTGDWADAASKAILERAAQRTAAWCKKYAIPVRRLTVAQVRDGKSKGLCGHDDVTKAFPDKGNGHWDPGPNFPWDAFLARVAQLVGGAAPTKPAPTPGPAPGKRAPRTLPTIRRGATGGWVGLVQKHIDGTDGQLDVDESFGPKTEEAVRHFQRRVGLADDGVVGPRTWAALCTDGDGRLRRGDRNAAVEVWQNVVGVAADGVFGSDTDAATRAVQRALGVADDGVVGPATRAALVAAWT